MDLSSLPEGFKCQTMGEAIERYGYIDFAAGIWPEQNRWTSLLAIPPDWFPMWRVMDTDVPVRRICCNVDIQKPLMTALQSVHDRGFQFLLKTFDGCCNIRMVRGAKNPSTHSYGLAIDLNAATNQLGATQGGLFTAPKFVQCFIEQGFAWGGDFKDRKDPMHFSYAWE